MARPPRGGHTHVPHSSVARRYARFTLGLALDDVPAPVVDKAKQLVLDIIGSCLASSREECGRPALRATESLGGPPESTLIGAATRVGASHAVLANGTLAHGLDFDDTREDAIVHTGSVAVTTALAVGEATGASGRAVLEAAIAGVEVMCRVGLAVPGRFHARHYHPTSLAGSFAAAAHGAARVEDVRGTLGRPGEPRELPSKPSRGGSTAHPYRACALRLRERHKTHPEQIVQTRCPPAGGPPPRLWEPLAAKHKPP